MFPSATGLRRLAPALFLAALASCSSTPSNTTTATRIFERLWSKGDFEVAKESLAPAYTWNENSNTGSNRENYQAVVKAYRRAFPDLTFEIENVVSSGDMVVVRWIARGTHRGVLNTIPATDKQVAVNGITMMRVENGRAVREWTTWDEAGMLRQIGIMP